MLFTSNLDIQMILEKYASSKPSEIRVAFAEGTSVNPEVCKDLRALACIAMLCGEKKKSVPDPSWWVGGNSRFEYSFLGESFILDSMEYGPDGYRHISSISTKKWAVTLSLKMRHRPHAPCGGFYANQLPGMDEIDYIFKGRDYGEDILSTFWFLRLGLVDHLILEKGSENSIQKSLALLNMDENYRAFFEPEGALRLLAELNEDENYRLFLQPRDPLNF